MFLNCTVDQCGDVRGSKQYEVGKLRATLFRITEKFCSERMS